MSSERQQLEAAISALETQRVALGDAVINTALVSLQEKLEALGEHPAGAQPQLKQVTVLFADVVDSTRLSQYLDPEDMLAVTDGALRRFAVIIERHGGRVLRFAGDGLLALFGAEATREDDPARAVRAGLALLEESRLHAAEVTTRFAVPNFAIRVGINTGQVLMGAGVEADKSAMGFAIHVARRMEESAPSGGLRMAHDTYRHVRGVFDVTEEAPLLVKGIDAPVRTYLALRAKPRAFRVRARGIEGIETRMVGRDAELAKIQESFETVVEDRELALVTVVADAGIGKSRLMYEFDNWLELRAETIWLFRGRGDPQTAGQPYGLLRDLFAWRFQIQDSDSLDVAREKLRAGIAPLFGASGDEPTALLGQLLGFDYAASPHIAGILQDARQIRDRAFHAAAQYFRRLSENHGDPVAILLDDIHWADDGSLDFINYLAEGAHDVPILVLCMARPVLFERRPRWGSGQASHQRIELTPLGKRGSLELAEVLLQRLTDVPQALRELITVGAEGNPFYMEELLKMLIDEGVIVTGPEQWQVVPERLVKVHVPPTLTGVLQVRLDALLQEEKTALQQAAVVGYVFWDEALAAIDAPSKAVLPALTRRELVFGRETSTVDEANEYVFKHHVLHQVTYDGVLKRDKREYHQKAAEWLAARSGARVNEYLGLIADHYERAGDTVNAAAYLRRAGKDAAQRYANDAALDYVNRALALTPETDLAGRCGLLLAREALFRLQGARPQERADLDAVAALADRLGDDALRAEAAARWVMYLNQDGDYAGAIEAAQRAVALAEAAAAPRIALRASTFWGHALRMQGSYAPAQARARADLATARANGDRRNEANALNVLGGISADQGDPMAALPFLEQALRHERALGDRSREAITLRNLGETERMLGNYEAAATWLEQALLLARSLGSRRYEGAAIGSLALIAHYLGHQDAGATQSRQALTISRATGFRQFEGSALTTLGHALAALLQHREAAEHYNAACNLWRELGNPNVATAAQAGLARVALAEGAVDVAIAHVEDILAHFARGGNTDGTDEPLRVYLTCFQVLAAAHDPRADALLATAHALLEERAAKINDPNAQRRFREDIPHHREIASAWAKRHGSASGH